LYFDKSRFGDQDKKGSTVMKQLKFSCSNLNTFTLDEEQITSDILILFRRCDAIHQNDSSIAFHLNLQLSIKKLAEKYGFVGGIELEVPNRGDGKRGYIDVVWYCGNSPIVVFEIDRRFRKKSIIKLSSVIADLKFWIYYGGDSPKSKELEYTPGLVYIIHRREFGVY
jgi:hypothetical protein